MAIEAVTRTLRTTRRRRLNGGQALRAARVRGAAALGGLLVLAALPGVAVGQSIEPRAYSPAPVGASYLVLNYDSALGGVVFDASSAVTDVHADINISAMALGHVFDLGGHQANVTVIAPYAWGELSGNIGENRRSGSRAGLADLRLRLSTMLVGGPALSLKDFVSRRQRPALGVSLEVVAPTGQYDPTRPINIGSHRWGLKPEIGFAYPSGPWQLDAYAGLWLYTDNGDYLGKVRQQAPIGTFQTHLSYTFRPGLWLAADATYYTGGTTTVGAFRNSDRLDNMRVGATLAVPVTRRQSLKVSYSDGALTRAGGSYRLISVAWVYNWLK
jgi:hypothetical protein